MMDTVEPDLDTIESIETISLAVCGWIPILVIFLLGGHAVYSLTESIPLLVRLEKRKSHALAEAERMSEQVRLLRRRTDALEQDPWTVERNLRTISGARRSGEHRTAVPGKLIPGNSETPNLID